MSGPVIVGAWLILAAAVIAVPGLIATLRRTPAESLSERHDRLDDEAREACAPDLDANVAAFERLGKEANR